MAADPLPAWLFVRHRSWHHTRGLEADAIDRIARGHVQALAVQIPERDVGRADLPLRLAADDLAG